MARSKHSWWKKNDEKQEMNIQQVNEEILTEVRDVSWETKVLTNHDNAKQNQIEI